MPRGYDPFNTNPSILSSLFQGNRSTLLKLIKIVVTPTYTFLRRAFSYLERLKTIILKKWLNLEAITAVESISPSIPGKNRKSLS